MESNRSRSASLPFPVLGENSRDPLLEMDPRYAVSMINIFPQGNYGEVRRGFRSHSTGLGTGAVETLATYVSTAGSKKLLGCANGRIYDATTYDAAATSLASGFTSNRWQTVTYLNTMIFVNGIDQPQQYNGTAVSAANYTTIADDAKLVDVCVFKERLYFIEKDTTKFWYGASATVTGALTSFEVGDFLNMGGYIQTIASWTTNTGSGMQDLLVLVSSEGEVLTYSGTDPATDFALEGRYFLPTPHGRRCKKNIGADLYILHQQGVTSIGQLISGLDVATGYAQFTDAIAPTFAGASSLYGDNLGWEIFFYPRGQMAMINIPTSSQSQAKQYVINTKSGAWCQFTGINALCWGLYDSKPYFGGSDGKVYQADITASDNSAAINASVKYAFNYFGSRDRKKAFHMAAAQIIGTNNARFMFNMDVDGASTITTDTIDITGSSGSAWDTSDWDTTDWGEESIYSTSWEGLTGYGRAGALKVSGKFLNSSIKISSAQIVFEQGGYL